MATTRNAHASGDTGEPDTRGHASSPRADADSAATGIEGFDFVLRGGLPAGRPSLLRGGPGTGKTVISLSFLCQGLETGEPGVLVTFDESPQALIRHADALGLGLGDHIEAGRARILDMRPDPDEMMSGESLELSAILARIDHAIEQTGARRLVIDAIDGLEGTFSGAEDSLHYELRRVFDWIRERETTTLITIGEYGDFSHRHGVEDYIADCVITLKQEVLGHTPELLRTGRQEDQESYTEMRRILEREGHWTGELRRCRKNGEIYQEWLSISPVRRDDGELIYYVAIFSDLTAINQLQQLAHHDYLTGLFNRAALQQHLDEEMRRIARYGDAFSLIMFDLDHFKSINDRHGHDTGDRVLQQVAELTLDEVRDTDITARWGGEEFMILLPATEGDQAQALAERLRKRIAATAFPEAGYITISLGIAEVRAGEDRQAMLIRLDQALYRAKETRNRSVICTEPGPGARSAS